MKKVSESLLDSIVEEMLEVVENSQDEIFEIGEDARTEYERLVVEIETIKDQVLTYIDEGDSLEREVQVSRQKLAKVSKNFNQYSEVEIRTNYDRTHMLQTQLVMLRQKEKSLRQKRDDLERRLRSLETMIERADDLASKISVILTYLNDDFQQVHMLIAEAREKQQFGLQIIEAQEEERKRISREIHDGPAQMLANILLRSELVERTYETGRMDLALEEMRKTRQMVQTSIEEVRRIIYDLRPMALDDLGLIPTIKKYIATMSDFNEQEIDFTIIGEEKRLDSKYEVALFRLMQESLQNAIKHAEASLIKVKLEIQSNQITLLIVDNGKGFDVSEKKDHSFGLVGMRERVEMLDGKLEINSKPNKGTIVYIQVPV